MISLQARSFPETRLRRVRQYEWSRDLVAETSLSVKDLIFPLFIREQESPGEIASMPGIRRYTIDEVIKVGEEACEYGIPVLALFPHTPNVLKDEDGTEALNENNLLNRALKRLKAEFGHDIGLLADVALDPYTSHGHDGVIRGGHVDNDETLRILEKQAVLHAQCGADIIAPSDMMDGRIRGIRAALDAQLLSHVKIMSYAAKYASAFYGPFREAVGAGKIAAMDQPFLKNKLTYQLDSRNSNQALYQTALDIAEGADMVIVKPGLPYLDILCRIKQKFAMPTFAYHVSGEYAMLRLAADKGYLDYEKCLIETLYSFKRSGADGIFTYAAFDAAKILMK